VVTRNTQGYHHDGEKQNRNNNDEPGPQGTDEHGFLQG
jgi:hypothetical protein